MGRSVARKEPVEEKDEQVWEQVKGGGFCGEEEKTEWAFLGVHHVGRAPPFIHRVSGCML